MKSKTKANKKTQKQKRGFMDGFKVRGKTAQRGGDLNPGSNYENLDASEGQKAGKGKASKDKGKPVKDSKAAAKDEDGSGTSKAKKEADNPKNKKDDAPDGGDSKTEEPSNN